MSKKIILSFSLFLIAGLAHARGDVLLIPKYIHVKLIKSEHTFGSNTIIFENGYHEAYGFEAGYLFKFGLAVTGEIGGYTLYAVRETAGTKLAHATIQWATAIATQYFGRENSVQPFIGAGFGSMSVGIHNSNTILSLDGYISLARAGLLLAASKHININFEYRYFQFKVDDVYNYSMESEGGYYGAGIVVRF